jgi:hypothetical protein
LGGLKEGILAIIEAFLTGFGLNIDEAVRILCMELETGDFSEVYNTALDISSNVVAPVATTIIGLCFFIEFLKMSIKVDMFKWEWAISAMFKFAVAKSALDITPQFLLAIYQKGTQLVTGANEHISTSAALDTISSGIRTLLENGEWYDALVIAITMSLIFIAVWAVGVFVIVMAYARTFEIILYMAVAPLPVAFLPLENSQITKRFALSFAAVIVQGLIMLVTIMLFNAVAGNLLTAEVDENSPMFPQIMAMSGQMLIATLCLITTIMKSGSIAKTVLGQG